VHILNLIPMLKILVLHCNSMFKTTILLIVKFKVFNHRTFRRDYQQCSTTAMTAIPSLPSNPLTTFGLNLEQSLLSSTQSIDDEMYRDESFKEEYYKLVSSSFIHHAMAIGYLLSTL